MPNAPTRSQVVMPDEAATAAILSFLDRIGIMVAVGPIAEDGVLPGMTVRRGVLHLDPARHHLPGDILHEAGHIAVTDPALRHTLDCIGNDGGEEMAAICWSYAAARAIGLDPALVFHDSGYRGGGQWLIDTFASGNYIGLPLLQCFGMTRDPEKAVPGEPAYPDMLRWLR